jgi:hypothetical protein
MSSASATVVSPIKSAPKSPLRAKRALSLHDLPSWLTSLCVHLAALLLLGLAQVAIRNSNGLSFEVSRALSDASDGAGQLDLNTSDGGQNGQLLTAGDLPSADEFTRPLDALVPTQPQLQLANLGPIADPSNFKLPSLGAPNSLGLGAGQGADGKSVGFGDGSKLGLGQTSFFGLHATGSKFVYVFDRSESMNYQYYTQSPASEFGNIPIRAAKAELLASIYELSPKQQFSIIFYNHQPRLYSPTDSPGRPVFATAENKQKLREQISELRGEGGTNHLLALQMAMRLHPDVIFLLTDGEAKDDLTTVEVGRLTEANKRYAMINVIQFAQQPRPNSTLIQLAKQNRGKHTFVDVTKVGEMARKLNAKLPTDSMADP